MNSRLIPLALTLALLPGVHACTIAYDDPVGDTEPTTIPGPYDVVRVEAIAGPESLHWRIQVAGLDNASTGAQYVGQIATSEAFFHPICTLEVERSAVPKAPACHLSTSSTAETTVAFRWVAALAGSVRGGWLEVEILYDHMGTGLGETLTDLSAISQLALSSTDQSISPVITDFAGDHLASLLLCQDAPAAPTERQVEAGRAKPTPPPSWVVCAVALLAFGRRLRPG